MRPAARLRGRPRCGTVHGSAVAMDEPYARTVTKRYDAVKSVDNKMLQVDGNVTLCYVSDMATADIREVFREYLRQQIPDGESKAETGRRLSLKPELVSMILTGTRNVSTKTVMKLAEALQRPLSTVLFQMAVVAAKLEEGLPSKLPTVVSGATPAVTEVAPGVARITVGKGHVIVPAEEVAGMLLAIAAEQRRGQQKPTGRTHAHGTRRHEATERSSSHK